MFGMKPEVEEYQCPQQDILRGLTRISIVADDILVSGCGDSVVEAVADLGRNLICLLEREAK